MNRPLVSVVIPFFSRKDWLEVAVDSVLQQTYGNIEILIINDGSKESIDDFLKKSSRIRVIHQENGGPALARNVGIANATGKYVAFLDSDDVWLPEKLTHQIHEMESNGYVWTQHSYKMFWDSKDKTRIVDTSVYAGNVYRDCFISFKVQTSCVVVLRRVLIEKNIRFPIGKRYGQDLDFYKNLAKEYELGFIDGVYTLFRRRKSNAGFRAHVQLNDKATTWEEIKHDSRVTQMLPKPVIHAYNASTKLARFTSMMNSKLAMTDRGNECLSKLVYVYPYIFFKAYARKIVNR